jgi:hypothetical protein
MKTIRWGMIGCGKVTEVKSGPPRPTRPAPTHRQLHRPENRSMLKNPMRLNVSCGESALRTSMVMDKLLKEREASYE